MTKGSEAASSMETIALYDFDAAAEDELSFKKGAILLVLKKKHKVWYTAELEGKDGLIPNNYIQMKEHGWYHSRITRAMAEELLSKQPQDGAFMIRDCQSTPGAFSLSVKVCSGVQHFRVFRECDGKFFLFAVKFTSLNQLVDYYRTSSVSRTQGIYLSNMVESTLVQATFDFETREADELPLHRGDIIIVLEKSDRYWWKGSCNGLQGLFPVTFVEAYTSSWSRSSTT